MSGTVALLLGDCGAWRLSAVSQVVVVVMRLLAGFTVSKDLLTGLCPCPTRPAHIQASLYAGGSLSGAFLSGWLGSRGALCHAHMALLRLRALT